MELNSLSEAGHRIEGLLKQRGYSYIQPYLLNRGRHVVLKAVSPLGECEVVYVLFKRAYFLSYSHQFLDTEGESFGESINLEYWEAIERSKMLSRILVAYKDGVIYSVDPKELKDYFSEKYRVRRQYGGEVTVSFPIHMLNRWDEKWTNHNLTEWINKPGISDKLKIMLRKLKERLFPTKIDIEVK